MSKISSIKVKQQDGYSEIPLAVTANNVIWDNSHTLVDIVNGKQDSLTFDSTPTAGSSNPVTSGGVYNAIQAGGGGGSSIYICTKETAASDISSALTAGKMVFYKDKEKTSGNDRYYVLAYAKVSRSMFLFTTFNGSFNYVLLENGEWTEGTISIDDENLSSRTDRIPLSSVVTEALGDLSSVVAEKQNRPTALTLILEASDWDDNTYTAYIADLTSDMLVQVSPAPASHVAYVTAKIRATEQDTGSLTFTCDTAPTEDITVNVVLSEVDAL